MIARSDTKEVLIAEPVHGTGYLPLYVGMAQNLFEGVTVKIVTIETGAGHANAVLSGQAFAFIGGPEHCAFAKAKGGETQNDEDDRKVGPPIAVTALPHDTRGERIIVLYRELPIPVQAVIDAMIADNVPKIWIPHLDGFVKVDSIPVLGTGKLDLAALKRKAAEAEV